MGERPRPAELAFSFAEVIYMALESEYRQGRCDLDAMLIRLKDLSAYSLEHPKIMEQREGVELLGLGMFFGMTSNPELRENQRRMSLLSEEAIDYKGRKENIEAEVADRNALKPVNEEKDGDDPLQPRLL